MSLIVIRAPCTSEPSFHAARLLFVRDTQICRVSLDLP